MTRLPLLILVLVLFAASSASAAKGDGLPVLGIEVGPQGVTVPASDTRYVALGAGRQTVIAEVDQDGGSVGTYRLLRGRFTIPAVAYDGSAGGLSADGRWLVLVRPRATFPQARTTFALVRTRGLRLRETITLRGDFSFDAISPDGRLLYLVQYFSPDDPTRYLVRLYDVRAGRLMREPVIDPREVGDVMRGTPVTRAASPDGRFAYTLYDDQTSHPFIHALDTTGRSARCIDLHGLMGIDLSGHRLDVDGSGGTLVVLDGRGDPVAVIDTRTSHVSEPEEAGAPGPAAEVRSGGEGRGTSWALLTIPALGALLLVAGMSLVHRRRRRLALG